MLLETRTNHCIKNFAFVPSWLVMALSLKLTEPPLTGTISQFHRHSTLSVQTSKELSKALKIFLTDQDFSILHDVINLASFCVIFFERPTAVNRSTGRTNGGLFLI